MHCLIVGSGGREHALALALSKSPSVSRLSMAPGNPGMEPLGQLLAIEPTDIEGLLIHAKREAVDLVIVGPEAPLAAGITDRFQQEGIAVFGPTQEAAQLEASKHFAKRIMQEASVPTGRFVYAETEAQALEALDSFKPPYVIKEDGLAAGKGVTVTADKAEAVEAINRAVAKASPVLLEEALKGEELSVFALCDGERALPLVAAQDFKRVGEGHTGPNTGGMGAYAPVPFVDAALMEQVQQQVLTPMVRTMAKRGTPYKGLLYAGLMISPEGVPNVIEFNCRFGDPETQVVVPLLEQAGVDLADLLRRCASDTLEGVSLPAITEAAVTVVLASQGYPGNYEKGKAITLPEQLPEGVRLYHAGTKRLPGGQLVTNGGRVLAVTATGTSVEAARQLAYETVEKVSFDGAFCRKDIAAALPALVQVK